MTEVLGDLESVKMIPVKKKIDISVLWESRSWRDFLEWPRIAAAVVVIFALFFLFYSLQWNRPSAVNLDEFDLRTMEMSKARREYEEYIQRARTPAGRPGISMRLIFS